MTWELTIGDTDLTGEALPQVRTSRGHDLGKTFTPRAGALSATLEGAHDVLHDALTLQDGTDDVWTGEVREQSRDYDAATREERTRIRASGPIAQIVAAGSGYNSDYYADITVDTAIGKVLDAIGFPADKRDIGASPRVLNYWWLDHNTSAWQVLLTLVRMAGPQARLTERADGTLVFRDEAAPAVPDVSYIFRKFGSGDGPVVSQLSNDEAGLERVVNDVSIAYRSVGSLASERIAALTNGGSAQTGISDSAQITTAEMQAAGIGSDDLVIVIGIASGGGGTYTLSLPPASSLTYLVNHASGTLRRFLGWRRGPATVSLSVSNLGNSAYIELRLIAVAYRNAADPAQSVSAFHSNVSSEAATYALPAMTAIAHSHVLSTAVGAGLFNISNALYYLQSALTRPDDWSALLPGSLSADRLLVAGGDISGNEWVLGDAVNATSRDVLILAVEIPAVRAVVYEHDATLVISGGETLDVEARSSSLFTAPITPIEDTDYDVDAGALDSVTLLPRNFGDRATIRLVASASGATVSDLQLRAIVVPDTTTEIATAEDAASVTAYGARQPRHRFWPYLDATQAQALADATIAAGAEPRRSFTIGIDADRNTATREAALGAELGEHVQVLLDDAFREGGEVAAIRHEIGKGGTLRTELTVAGAGWVPFAPSGLTAATGDGEVTLSWTDPADDDITGYQYRVSDDSGATWSPDWTDVEGADATTTSHTIAELSNGTSYTFELRAVGGGGPGEVTSVSATPPLKAAPTSLASATGDGEVTLSWTDPSDTDLTGYQYRVSSDSGTTWSPDWTDITDSDAMTVSYTVTGLTNDTAYSFELRAVSAGGPGTAASISATPAAGS